jgi:hypothetical protein
MKLAKRKPTRSIADNRLDAIKDAFDSINMVESNLSAVADACGPHTVLWLAIRSLMNDLYKIRLRLREVK